MAIFNSKLLVKLPEGSLRWEFCVPNMTHDHGQVKASVSDPVDRLTGCENRSARSAR